MYVLLCGNSPLCSAQDTLLMHDIFFRTGILGMRSVGEQLLCVTLRKHAYSNILNILSPKKKKKKKKNSDKNSYILHISAQNIDCGYSLEPP